MAATTWRGRSGRIAAALALGGASMLLQGNVGLRTNLDTTQIMRTSRLLDGSVWDGTDPAGYARSFNLHALNDH